MKSSDIQKAIKMYQAGVSQKDIGKILGVSGQLISRYLRESGIETCIGGYNEPRSKVESKHQEVIARYRRGETRSAIARAMNMSASGVAYIINKLNP